MKNVNIQDELWFLLYFCVFWKSFCFRLVFYYLFLLRQLHL